MKTVKQLSKYELDELRINYFYDESISHSYTNVEDIPNKVLFEHYGSVSFVKEDFFCNI